MTTWVKCPACGWIDVQATFPKGDGIYDCPACDSLFTAIPVTQEDRPEETAVPFASPEACEGATEE